MPGVSRSNNCVNSLLDCFGGGAGAAGRRGASGACGGITASNRDAPGSGCGDAGVEGGVAAMPPNTCVKLSPAVAAGETGADGGAGFHAAAGGPAAIGVVAGGFGVGGVAAIGVIADGIGTGARFPKPPNTCEKLSSAFSAGEAGADGGAAFHAAAGGMAATGVGAIGVDTCGVGASDGAAIPPNTWEKLSPPFGAGGTGETGGVTGADAVAGGGGAVGLSGAFTANCRVKSPGCAAPGTTVGAGLGGGPAGVGGGGPVTAPNISVNEGAGGLATGASGVATAAGAKIAVKPALVALGGAATGAAGAGGTLGAFGTAAINSVLVSSTIALSRTHDGRSVKVVRKRVTTVVIPSTSWTPSTCSAAAGWSEPTAARRRCRSIAVPTSSVCTMTMRPSATSCAIWLRAPCSVSVFRTRYVAANSALVITWGQRVRYRRDEPLARVRPTSQYIAIGHQPSQHEMYAPYSASSARATPR